MAQTGLVPSGLSHPPAVVSMTMSLVLSSKEAPASLIQDRPCPSPKAQGLRAPAACLPQPPPQDPSGHLASACVLACLPCQQAHYLT